MTLPCRDCTNTVTWFATSGRRFLYAPDVEVSIPEDLVLPTCRVCHKVHLYGNAGLLLEKALRPEYEAARKDRVNFAVTKLQDVVPELQLVDIANLCGVTEGLLNKVLSGAKVATPMLIRLLEALSLHPEEVSRHLEGLDLRSFHALQERVADLEIKVIRNTVSREERQEYIQLKARLPQDIGEEARRIVEGLRRDSEGPRAR